MDLSSVLKNHACIIFSCIINYDSWECKPVKEVMCFYFRHVNLAVNLLTFVFCKAWLASSVVQVVVEWDEFTLLSQHFKTNLKIGFIQNFVTNESTVSTATPVNQVRTNDCRFTSWKKRLWRSLPSSTSSTLWRRPLITDPFKRSKTKC